MDILLSVMKDFGFPVALLCAFAWYIRQMHADRINTLEKLVNELGARIELVEADRLRRAEAYAHDLKALALRQNQEARETRTVLSGLLDVTRKLLDSLPFQFGGEPPPPRPRRTPSSAEVPADPAQAPTDRIMQHG